MLELRNMMEVEDAEQSQILSSAQVNYIEELIRHLDPMERYDDFELTFGGNFYLLQDKEDLDKVITEYELQLPLSTTLGHPDFVDQFRDGSLAIIYITNNSGGNTYFVPKNLVMPHMLLEAEAVNY